MPTTPATQELITALKKQDFLDAQKAIANGADITCSREGITVVHLALLDNNETAIKKYLNMAAFKKNDFIAELFTFAMLRHPLTIKTDTIKALIDACSQIPNIVTFILDDGLLQHFGEQYRQKEFTLAEYAGQARSAAIAKALTESAKKNSTQATDDAAQDETEQAINTTSQEETRSNAHDTSTALSHDKSASPTPTAITEYTKRERSNLLTDMLNQKTQSTALFALALLQRIHSSHDISHISNQQFHEGLLNFLPREQVEHFAQRLEDMGPYPRSFVQVIRKKAGTPGPATSSISTSDGEHKKGNEISLDPSKQSSASASSSSSTMLSAFVANTKAILTGLATTTRDHIQRAVYDDDITFAFRQSLLTARTAEAAKRAYTLYIAGADPTATVRIANKPVSLMSLMMQHSQNSRIMTLAEAMPWLLTDDTLNQLYSNPSIEPGTFNEILSILYPNRQHDVPIKITTNLFILLIRTEKHEAIKDLLSKKRHHNRLYELTDNSVLKNAELQANAFNYLPAGIFKLFYDFLQNNQLIVTYGYHATFQQMIGYSYVSGYFGYEHDDGRTYPFGRCYTGKMYTGPYPDDYHTAQREEAKQLRAEISSTNIYEHCLLFRAQTQYGRNLFINLAQISKYNATLKLPLVRIFNGFRLLETDGCGYRPLKYLVTNHLEVIANNHINNRAQAFVDYGTAMILAGEVSLQTYIRDVGQYAVNAVAGVVTQLLSNERIKKDSDLLQVMSTIVPLESKNSLLRPIILCLLCELGRENTSTLLNSETLLRLINSQSTQEGNNFLNTYFGNNYAAMANYFLGANLPTGALQQRLDELSTSPAFATVSSKLLLSTTQYQALLEPSNLNLSPATVHWIINSLSAIEDLSWLTDEMVEQHLMQTPDQVKLTILGNTLIERKRAIGVDCLLKAKVSRSEIQEQLNTHIPGINLQNAIDAYNQQVQSRGLIGSVKHYATAQRFAGMSAR